VQAAEKVGLLYSQAGAHNAELLHAELQGRTVQAQLYGEGVPRAQLMQRTRSQFFSRAGLAVDDD